MAYESKASKETFPKRTRRPGPAAGLANETRPGLGTRGEGTKAPPPQTRPTPHDHEPLGRDAPDIPREPREQPSDSVAHELERDTGVSGHSGGT